MEHIAEKDAGLVTEYVVGFLLDTRCHEVALIRKNRPADPRTTEHYDRARGNLDRHGVHFLTAYVAGV